MATVSSPRAVELKLAIATYESLIASYTVTRERLLARRRGAADNVMVELDERLVANERTIASLRRALDVAQSQLQFENHPGGGWTPSTARGHVSEHGRKT